MKTYESKLICVNDIRNAERLGFAVLEAYREVFEQAFGRVPKFPSADIPPGHRGLSALLAEDASSVSARARQANPDLPEFTFEWVLSKEHEGNCGFYRITIPDMEVSSSK